VQLVLVLQALAQQLEARERAVQAEAVVLELVEVALVAVLVLVLALVAVAVVDHHHRRHRPHHQHHHRCHLAAICAACGLLQEVISSIHKTHDMIMQRVERSFVIARAHAYSAFEVQTLMQQHNQRAPYATRLHKCLILNQI
jgi:hypothetical protein